MEPSPFGRLVKYHRESAGLTQEELAERAGISARAISDLERGVNRGARRDTVQLLATALGLTGAGRTRFEEVARGRAAPPPPSATPSMRYALPTPLTPLIGRAREVAAVCRLLRGSAVRLATLTGPGGIGKTRLSLQAASELSGDFADGVAFVPLAPLVDPLLIPSAMAQALGVEETAGRSLIARLAAFLREKSLLLVLDNFEQVVAGAPVLAELLTACPRLKLLVTSRATLGLPGEWEYAVPPLATPNPAQLPPLGRVAEYEAVRLFVERAQAVRRTFALTEENAAAVAGICHRLDGLPLAIELAAARTRILSPQAILARLAQRLSLLTRGDDELPDRHRTLRAAIAWSHDLLDEGERVLFRRLAIFSGGFTVAAVEAVWRAVVDEAVDLDLVDALAAQNLLRPEAEVGGEIRLVMLETIREFAFEQLQAYGEAATWQRAHATLHLALAEEAEPRLLVGEQARWGERLEAEHDNLRAALEWSLGGGDPDLALCLAGALWRFWLVRGHLSEGRRWLDRALAGAAGASALQVARALLGVGAIARNQGDHDEAAASLAQSLVLYRGTGDRAGTAHVLNNLGVIAWDRGEYDRAQALHEEALALRRAAGDRWGIAALLNNLALTAHAQADYARAAAWYVESLEIRRGLGDRQGIAASLINLGLLAHQRGDFRQAEVRYAESLVVCRELGDARNAALTLVNRGLTAQCRGEYDRAITLCEEGLALYRELGNKYGVALALNILGMTMRCRGEWDRARALFGESLALARELRDKRNTAWVLDNLAILACDDDDSAGAAGSCAESLDLRRALRDKGGTAGSLATLARIARAEGDAVRAAALLAESLGLYREVGESPGIAACLEGLAGVAALQGEDVRAAALYAAAEAARNRFPAPLPPMEQREHDCAVAGLRARLSPGEFAATWRTGTGLSLGVASDLALATPSGNSPAP